MTAIILDTPDKIARYRLLTLRAALRLEIAGMKKRGKSAYQILKAEGYSGTRAQVLEQLHNIHFLLCNFKSYLSSYYLSYRPGRLSFQN